MAGIHIRLRVLLFVLLLIASPLFGASAAHASLASPTITTNPFVTSETVGSAALKDIAHLTGGSSPTGIITFTLVGPSSVVVDTETVVVSGNGDYTTPVGNVPVQAGAYQWDASYSGDTNNNAASDNNDPNEQVTVVPATPTITTNPFPTSEAAGGSALKDIAHLTGGFNPTGTITFTLVSPSSTVVDTETVLVSGNGDYTTPVGFVPLVAGTYQWDASYSGDPNNNAVSDNNDVNEQVTVTSVVITSTPSPTSENVGGPALQDIAHLTGGFNPTGSITFTLFSPSSTIVDTETVPVSGNGDYTTPVGFVPVLAGTYQWDVSYSGDVNNAHVSDNNAVNERVTVSSTTPAPVPEFGAFYIAIALGAAVYFALTRRFMRRPMIPAQIQAYQ